MGTRDTEEQSVQIFQTKQVNTTRSARRNEMKKASRCPEIWIQKVTFSQDKLGDLVRCWRGWQPAYGQSLWQ